MGLGSGARTGLQAACGVAGVVAAGAAGAADLPPLYAQPLYGEAPEIKPVEIGTGWYLRGDVGFGFETNTNARYDEGRPEFTRYPGRYMFGYDRYQYDIFNEDYDSMSISESAEFGVGIGYQFTDYFRGDLTANYWTADVSGNDRFDSCANIAPAVASAYGISDYDSRDLDCTSSTSSEVDGLEVMANAYADLGTYVGLTPYIGVGAGAVRISYDDVSVRSNCTYQGASCFPANTPAYYDIDTKHEGAESWRFAYALMAGMSYNVSRNLKIDVGYRYLDVEGGKMYEFDDSYIDRNRIGMSGEDDGFGRHSLRAGIRYSLW